MHLNICCSFCDFVLVSLVGVFVEFKSTSELFENVCDLRLALNTLFNIEYVDGGNLRSKKRAYKRVLTFRFLFGLSQLAYLI